jgi:hypothetical protein
MTHSYFPSSGVWDSLLCGVALKVNAWRSRTAVRLRERREAGGGKRIREGGGRNRAEKEAATSTATQPPATKWAGPKRATVFFFIPENVQLRVFRPLFVRDLVPALLFMKTPFARHPVAQINVYVSVTP